MKFHELLKNYRLRQRPEMTQKEIALKAGVKASYISMLESGEAPPPIYETCEKLTKGLGLNSADAKKLIEAAFLEKQDADYQKALRIKNLGEYFGLLGGEPVEDLPFIDWPSLPLPNTTEGIMKYRTKVIDNAMQPEFSKGDEITIDNDLKPISGDFVVAKREGQNPLLRLYKEVSKQKVLMTFDRESREIVLKDEPHDIIGVVIEKVKSYRAS